MRDPPAGWGETGGRLAEVDRLRVSARLHGPGGLDTQGWRVRCVALTAEPTGTYVADAPTRRSKLR